MSNINQIILIIPVFIGVFIITASMRFYENNIKISNIFYFLKKYLYYLTPIGFFMEKEKLALSNAVLLKEICPECEKKCDSYSLIKQFEKKDMEETFELVKSTLKNRVIFKIWSINIAQNYPSYVQSILDKTKHRHELESELNKYLKTELNDKEANKNNTFNDIIIYREQTINCYMTYQPKVS